MDAEAMNRREELRRTTRLCEAGRHAWPLDGRCQACRAQAAENERDAVRAALAKSEAECERLGGLKVGEVLADAGRSLDLPDGETWDRTRAVLGRLFNATLALLECLSGKDAVSVILRPQTEAVRAVLADPDGVKALALWRALETVATVAQEQLLPAHEEESLAVGFGGKCGCDLCAAIAALEEVRRRV